MLESVAMNVEENPTCGTFWIDLPKVADERGALSFVHQGEHLPFDFERVYYLTELSSVYARGFHAHKQLKQAAFCLSGSCKILFDDGLMKYEAVLNKADKGIYIPPMVWHEMHDFSDDCVFLVFASDQYDESDYIRDYREFTKLLSVVK